jgi:hypothetical protein
MTAEQMIMCSMHQLGLAYWCASRFPTLPEMVRLGADAADDLRADEPAVKRAPQPIKRSSRPLPCREQQVPRSRSCRTTNLVAPQFLHRLMERPLETCLVARELRECIILGRQP